MVDLGKVCYDYQDRVLRNLTSKRVQCDELVALIGCHERRLKPGHKEKGWGNCWTWTALDADTKLAICWHVGLREAADAVMFMENLASRLSNRIQLSTDGFPGYFYAVDNAFGSAVDYGQIVKSYGNKFDEERIGARYSPSRCNDVQYRVIKGKPSQAHISTSFNERNNLTMRMHMGRFMRMTNRHSKKLENHAYNVAVHFMYYNFARWHQTLRCTPAMAAGISDHIWELEEIVGLLENPGQKAA